MGGFNALANSSKRGGPTKATGLISQTGNDDVNPEECLAVGTVLQSELD